MIPISHNRRVRQEPGRGGGLGEEGAATVLGFLAAAGLAAAGFVAAGFLVALAAGTAASPEAEERATTGRGRGLLAPTNTSIGGMEGISGPSTTFWARRLWFMAA